MRNQTAAKQKKFIRKMRIREKGKEKNREKLNIIKYINILWNPILIKGFQIKFYIFCRYRKHIINLSDFSLFFPFFCSLPYLYCIFVYYLRSGFFFILQNIFVCLYQLFTKQFISVDFIRTDAIHTKLRVFRVKFVRMIKSPAA